MVNLVEFSWVVGRGFLLGVVSLDRYIPGCVRATRLARASPVAAFVDYVEVVDNGVSARLNKERPRVLKGHIDDQIRGEVEGV